MSLVLNEEQELLQDSARDFVTNSCPIDWLRKVRGEADSIGYDADVWRQMVELGWTAIPFAEDVGGLGLGYAEVGVVLEELGKRLAVTPYLSSVVLGGGAVDLGGTDAQRLEILPGVCEGTTLLALAYQETQRHDPYAISTSAKQNDGGYLLSGRKVLVLDGAAADRLIVVARTSGASGDRDGLTLFVVDPKASGVEVTRGLLLDSRSAAHLQLNNVAVDSSAVIGEVDAGADVLDTVLDRAAIAASAEMLGGVQEAFERTVEYLKEREQFGAKIGSFQGLKHRAARWFCEVELTRSIVAKALRAIDGQDPKVAEFASTCKARASDAFRQSGQEGVQMHGGMGVTDEADIGFFLKRARVSELLLGDSAYHRNRFAEMRGF
ncbi:MAG: acyl-CoA dehydrogenase [Pseudomonadales bacterium]|jgi:alkylation response protein AidB-like acyl-CoA dehydrogenase